MFFGGYMSVILDNCVAVIDFELTQSNGVLLNRSSSYSYIHGLGNVVPGMEKVLAGKTVGEEISADISAIDGFGVAQDFEPVVYTRQQLGEHFSSLFVGQGIPFRNDHGQRVVFYVLGLENDSATFTINHPWAGKELHFAAKVLSIRCATDQELEQGYPFEDQEDNIGSCSCC